MKLFLFLMSAVTILGSSAFSQVLFSPSYPQNLICQKLAVKYGNIMQGQTPAEKQIICRTQATLLLDSSGNYNITAPITRNGRRGVMLCGASLADSPTGAKTPVVTIMYCKMPPEPKPGMGVGN